MNYVSKEDNEMIEVETKIGRKECSKEYRREERKKKGKEVWNERKNEYRGWGRKKKERKDHRKEKRMVGEWDIDVNKRKKGKNRVRNEESSKHFLNLHKCFQSYLK